MAVIYSMEGDPGLLNGYHIGPRGVEPKLKWKFGPIPNVSGDNISGRRFFIRLPIGALGGCWKTSQGRAQVQTIRVNDPAALHRLMQLLGKLNHARNKFKKWKKNLGGHTSAHVCEARRAVTCFM